MVAAGPWFAQVSYTQVHSGLVVVHLRAIGSQRGHSLATRSAAPVTVSAQTDASAEWQRGRGAKKAPCVRLVRAATNSRAGRSAGQAQAPAGKRKQHPTLSALKGNLLFEDN
eukprot:3796967-Amphidinium_carterae.1